MLKPEYILSICLIVFFISCGDLQKPSSTSKCDDALNAQNYDLAITSCTSSKEKGDAYMGKAGFTVVNLINNSSGETQPDKIKNADSKLGTVDSTGSKIMYIIGIASSQINSASDRKTKLSSAKSAFDSAWASYKGVISSNKDAALMYTYANVFAMQIDQINYYDGMAYACKDASNCSGDDKYTVAKGYNALINYDGYIFPADKSAKQNSGSSVKATCTGLKPSMEYLTRIADGLSKSGSSTDGSNTKVIKESQDVMCSTLKTLKDSCALDGSGKSDCETECTSSACS